VLAYLITVKCCILGSSLIPSLQLECEWISWKSINPYEYQSGKSGDGTSEGRMQRKAWNGPGREIVHCR